MSRVRAIHFMQSPVTTIASAGVLFILAMWGIGREVWVARVLRNMPPPMDVAAFLRFYFSAFIDTRFIVQVLLVLAIMAFCALLLNLVRATRQVLVQFA